MKIAAKKIFLIGFMGSGKTTLGKKLAKQLEFPFFDLDVAIEKSTQKTINRLFKEHGEDYFRAKETQVLHQTTNNNEVFVMALGGGTPCFHKNMEFINKHGVSIYLKYNSGMLFSRLLNAKTQRPLIAKKSSEDLKLFIENKLQEREVDYLQSKIVVEDDNLKIQKIIELVSQINFRKGM